MHEHRGWSRRPSALLPASDLHAGEKTAGRGIRIFSFTQKGDREKSAHVVGVHARARLVDRAGLVRSAPYEIDGVEPLVFHAQPPSDLMTLTVSALSYDAAEGRCTPPYTLPRSKWGYGLRYIDASHAANILRDAAAHATLALASASASERVVLEH